MSKYNALWEYIKNSGEDELALSFDEITKIAETPVDHSFLNYKKELTAFGYAVEKISLKNSTVRFKKLP